MDKYVSFRLDKEEFGIPILHVQEILKATEIVRLPQMHDYMLGVLNIRGKVVPVVDLKKRLFGSYCSGEEEKKRLVVINVGRLTYAGLVERITGVVEVNRDEIQDPASSDRKTDYIVGVALLGGERVFEIIDPSKVIPVKDVDLLKEDIVSEEAYGDGKVMVSKRVGSMGGEYVVNEVRDRIIEEAEKRGEDVAPIKEMMEKIEAFMKALSRGDFGEMERIVQDLATSEDKGLFQEVGRIARNIHDSLVEFKTLIDPRLKNLALEEMPDVADRLNWVISKTEESAAKTLGLMEKNLALQSDLIKRLDLLDGKVEGEEEREALSFIRAKLEDMNSDFMEVIMAQEFQDLTGQIIKKVISLITEVEAQLIELVRVFGVKIEPRKKEALSGPQIRKSEDVLANQEEVDALLKEFGF